MAVESRHMQWRDSVTNHAKFHGVTKRAASWNFSLRRVIYKILVLKELKYKKKFKEIGQQLQKEGRFKKENYKRKVLLELIVMPSF